VEFISRDQALLTESRQIRNDIQNNKANKLKSIESQALNKESELLQQRLTDLAVNTNVVSDKVGTH
jgi:hypothetical protein